MFEIWRKIKFGALVFLLHGLSNHAFGDPGGGPPKPGGGGGVVGDLPISDYINHLMFTALIFGVWAINKRKVKIN